MHNNNTIPIVQDYNLEIHDFDLIVDEIIQLYSKEYLLTVVLYVEVFHENSRAERELKHVGIGLYSLFFTFITIA